MSIEAVPLLLAEFRTVRCHGKGGGEEGNGRTRVRSSSPISYFVVVVGSSARLKGGGGHNNGSSV